MVFSKRLSAKDTDGPITYRPVQKTQTRSVTPTGYRGNQVKIGIEASKDRFTILRREVLERDLATPPA